jgi:hypothetical protein
MTKPENLSDVKTIDQLGQFVGLKEGDGSAILAEVRENHRKLATCTRHEFFRPKDGSATFARRFTCLHCGGTMTGEKIHWYAEGVKHGGELFDVWTD